uniref:tRNA(His) guanylyltransferase n=1 Tax=Physcomitrium patens TaxID=3218 RepID=A0A7I4BM60_PHYPA|nr:tRNA(His) guanylyltransferase 1-like isoform X3 [Physcomitrium patens]|eukprot:XP_024380998.1 tRNA(His) guanylyltransferase 1-like isoform X3 [Physcomitrella patens]
MLVQWLWWRIWQMLYSHMASATNTALCCGKHRHFTNGEPGFGLSSCNLLISKLISVICSLFASSYVMNWGKYFPETKLQYAPAFDGRAVCYPSESILRDYLSWRQVDCHINNQYNTCFWNLVGSGKSTAESQNMLKGTTADVKNNLLFDTFKINYNDLPQIFRKGSIVYRKKVEKVVKVEDGQEIKRLRSCAVVEHEDIIRDNFWTQYPYILGGK